jgi:probable rRNA maturation factor
LVSEENLPAAPPLESTETSVAAKDGGSETAAPFAAEQDPAAEAAGSITAVAESGLEQTTDEATPKSPRRRASSRTKTESPISVNVVVPRGMGRRVNSRLIERAVRLALERDGWSRPASLDVLMVSEGEMLEINVTRRGVDEATDVLAFPLVELRPGGTVAEDFFVIPPEQEPHLGDVVISFERVESQAEAAGHSKDRELAFLTVHAVLHILGYDHDTESARRQMRRREEEVLGELGLRRDGS